MSIPKEVAKKVKLLEIQTRKIVNSMFAGTYHSAFKGQGMTFADFREYVPGDDVRSISWPLTARTGKTYIKKYEEERELSLVIAVDVSGSLDYGGKNLFKGEAVTHMAALLAFAAAKNNDNVGMLLFSDQMELYIPPKKGRGHIQRLLTDLYNFRPKSRGTGIRSGLDYLKGVLKKKAHVFIFSDFMDEGYSPSLRVLSKKHDTVAVIIEDPSERVLPKLGLMDVSDPETGEMLTLDFSSERVRKQYDLLLREQIAKRDGELKKAQVEKIEVINREDVFQPLIQYFRKKVK